VGFRTDQYRLIDFGQGKKLEQFGGTVVRRDTPSVPDNVNPNSNVIWESELDYRKTNATSGQWFGRPPVDWQVACGDMRFKLKPTPAGQVGLFPEQAEIWDWIAGYQHSLAGCRALNLFAYTGGTTQALTLAGAKVAHVDAAQNIVKWARQNAAAAGMDQLPIRWIVEDASKFMEREIRRGVKYEILVADPPSYGKGPKRETWKFERDIARLIDGFAELASEDLKMVVLTSHTPGFDAESLRNQLRRRLKRWPGQWTGQSLYLETSTRKRLHSGHAVKFAAMVE
jgi:23S rRNA (cytosine1962-C5)-methyltransferase